MLAQYLDQLERDPTKDFGTEFVRVSNLERKLVDEYGFDAICLIFRNNNSDNYSALGNFPNECPWQYLNSTDVATFINTVFAPISSDIPNLINALKKRCSYIYAEKTDSEWLLHYFLDIALHDGRPYYRIYSGGAPNENPKPNSCLNEYDWSIPSDLKRLYAVHDGFGPILGSDAIKVMSKTMDPICKEHNLALPQAYHFRDLLEFHPDGGGNGQFFYRTGTSLTTVDWDHETWEISRHQGFLEYIDQRLSQLDEE